MEFYQAFLIALMGYLAAECVPWLMGDFGGYYVQIGRASCWEIVYI